MSFIKKTWNQYKVLFPVAKLVSYICGCEFNNELEKILYKSKIQDNALDNMDHSSNGKNKYRT